MNQNITELQESLKNYSELLNSPKSPNSNTVKPIKKKEKIIVESKTKEELLSLENNKNTDKSGGGFFEVPKNKQKEFDEDQLDRYSDYEENNTENIEKNLNFTEENKEHKEQPKQNKKQKEKENIESKNQLKPIKINKNDANSKTHFNNISKNNTDLPDMLGKK